MAEDSPLERLHRAWLAPGLNLLGFHCRPLCLGHILLLQALRSPFVGDSARFDTLTAGDVFTFLTVCSSARWPFRDVDFPPPEEQAEAIAAIHASPDAGQGAISAILEWISECSISPELWKSEETKGRSLTAPSVLCYAGRLLGKFSERRIFTMPLGMVRFYACAIAEIEGADIRFMTEEDLEIEAQLAAAAGREG